MWCHPFACRRQSHVLLIQSEVDIRKYYVGAMSVIHKKRKRFLAALGGELRKYARKYHQSKT
jgi:hypothetical protein